MLYVLSETKPKLSTNFNKSRIKKFQFLKKFLDFSILKYYIKTINVNVYINTSNLPEIASENLVKTVT